MRIKGKFNWGEWDENSKRINDDQEWGNENNAQTTRLTSANGWLLSCSVCYLSPAFKRAD